MKLLSCCWVILCSLVAAYGDSPTNEFAFSDLTIQVADLDGNPVPGAEVRAYHTEWYLAYPRGDFAHTAADGACTLRVPQGLYRIVVGGGTAYHAAGSGRGLFLAEAARVAGDTRVTLKPDASSALRCSSISSSSSAVRSLTSLSSFLRYLFSSSSLCLRFVMSRAIPVVPITWPLSL